MHGTPGIRMRQPHPDRTLDAVVLGCLDWGCDRGNRHFCLLLRATTLLATLTLGCMEIGRTVPGRLLLCDHPRELGGGGNWYLDNPAR